MESPLRFQAVVAVVAISGALLFTRGRPAVDPVLTFLDPEITESSGLVQSGTMVLTVNDSGESRSVVYAVNGDTGQTVGHTTYTTDDVVDVEAITEGPDGSIWVGDIGDNGAERARISVYQLPPVGAGERTVESRRFDLVYNDGPKDAEALLVHPESGRLHVVSKGLLGGRIYQAPAELSAESPNVLRPAGPVGGLVTDGTYFPDGRHVLLRSYSSASVHDSRGWRELASMRLPIQPQGEGVAMSPGGRRVLLSSEGAGTKVLSVALSKEVLAAVEPDPEVAPSSASEPDALVTEERVAWVGIAAAGLAAVLAGWLSVQWLRGSRRRSRSRR